MMRKNPFDKVSARVVNRGGSRPKVRPAGQQFKEGQLKELKERLKSTKKDLSLSRNISNSREEMRRDLLRSIEKVQQEYIKEGDFRKVKQLEDERQSLDESALDALNMQQKANIVESFIDDLAEKPRTLDEIRLALVGGGIAKDEREADVMLEKMTDRLGKGIHAFYDNRLTVGLTDKHRKGTIMRDVYVKLKPVKWAGEKRFLPVGKKSRIKNKL